VTSLFGFDLRAGDEVTVTVYRGKKRMDVKVVLGEAKGTA